MTNSSPTKKSSLDFTPAQRLQNVKMKRALLALASLSPEKRAEIVMAEAKKRGLVKASD